MSSNSDSEGSGGVKVEDLSFYSSPADTSYALAKQESGVVQGGVKVVREGAIEGISMVKQAMSSVTHVVDTGVAHSSAAYYQLTEEDNLPARVGVITGAGLLGLAVGAARGRLVKRVLYTLVGAGGGAAFCYPEQARETGDMVYQGGRDNIMQAYNIIAGDITPPSLADISSKVTNTDMSLIASTMSRVLYVMARKMKEVYQLGQKQVAVMMEQMNTDKEDDKTAVGAFTVPEIVVATNEVTK